MKKIIFTIKIETKLDEPKKQKLKSLKTKDFSILEINTPSSHTEIAMNNIKEEFIKEMVGLYAETAVIIAVRNLYNCNK